VAVTSLRGSGLKGKRLVKHKPAAKPTWGRTPFHNKPFSGKASETVVAEHERPEPTESGDRFALRGWQPSEGRDFVVTNPNQKGSRTLHSRTADSENGRSTFQR